MYTIRKKNRIKEQLQICYASGEPALVLEVNLDTYKILPKFQKLKEQLGVSLLETKKNPDSEEAVETVGKAIIEFFNLVFGEEQTTALLDFYNGDKSSALADVYTFLCEEIFPQVEAAQEQLKQEIEELARRLKEK